MLRLIGVYDYTVIVTYMSLFCAVAGMTKAAEANFSGAVLCLLLSGICDAFDGTIARTKKNRTEDEKAFGIQLDSLCDVISFGVFPAFVCYHMGVDGLTGLLCIFLYCLCAVIRLAFFNVLEGNRQKTESGCNHTYRGLPVTSISLIFPLVYCVKGLVSAEVFAGILHVMLVLVAFLFVLDFSVRKPDLQKLFAGKRCARKED